MRGRMFLCITLQSWEKASRPCVKVMKSFSKSSPARKVPRPRKYSGHNPRGRRLFNLLGGNALHSATRGKGFFATLKHFMSTSERLPGKDFRESLELATHPR